MEKLREIENYGFKILTEKAKDGSMTVYAKFGEAEKRNQNFRIYPHKILSREVNRVQAKIAAGQFLGQADHSDSPATFLKDVSHVVTGLEMKGNEGYATIKILNTDAGRNVQEIIRGKGRVGISTRSVGTVDAKTGIVQSDLKLLALDLVANPSVKDATIGKENILEGIEFEEENLHHHEKIVFEDGSGLDQGDVAKEMKRRAELEEAVVNLLNDSFHKAVEDGMFFGTYEEYKAKYGKGLREMMGLSVAPEVIEQAERKLTEEQIKRRIWNHYEEGLRAGFRGNFEDWKKKYPRLVEQASEPIKISEEKAKPKEPFKSRATWEEIQLSGFTGTMEEYEKQFPDITIIRPKPLQKKIIETIEQEATRIFEALKKDNPNSDLKLETVRNMLEKEEEEKIDKRIRRKALAIVSRECDGSVSNERLKEMVDIEFENLKEEQAEKKRKELLAYRKLLDE